MLLAALLCTAPAWAQAPAPGFPPRWSLADLVEQTSPAVVAIYTAQEVPPSRAELYRAWMWGQTPRPRVERGLGSGFLVDPEGLLLTNHHVVDGADDIVVQFKSGDELRARLLGSDRHTDLALLQVEGAAGALPSLPLAPNGGQRPGDWVLAIGNPYGLGQTVSAGIISSIDRSLELGDIWVDRFIQTDAGINPGNSGGPLIDLEGQVVGVSTAVHAEGQNLAFAIPVPVVRRLLPLLRDQGEVERGWFGWTLNARGGQVVVSGVQPGSPAEAAGLRRGDRLIRLGERRLEGAADVYRALNLVLPGDQVMVSLERGGLRLSTRALGVQRREWVELQVGPPRQIPALDAALQLLPPDDPLLTELRLPGALRVIEAGPESELEAGDVLLSVQRRVVEDLPGLERTIGEARDQIVVELLRKGRVHSGLLALRPGR